MYLNVQLNLHFLFGAVNRTCCLWDHQIQRLCETVVYCSACSVIVVLYGMISILFCFVVEANNVSCW